MTTTTDRSHLTRTVPSPVRDLNGFLLEMFESMAESWPDAAFRDLYVTTHPHGGDEGLLVVDVSFAVVKQATLTSN